MRWVVLLVVGILGAALSGLERPEQNGAGVLRLSAEVSAAPAVVLEPVTTGVPSITGITPAGDIRLFLTTQSGAILIWDGTQVLPTPFLDLSTKITCCGERGLLSTAFHPLYATNGFFFVNYTNLDGDTVVARYRVSSGDPNRADPDSAAILLTIPQPYANHNGGQLQFGPDGFLYIGMGDGGSGNDPECRAQSNQTLLGKLLRIDVNQNVYSPPFYGIPPENPFVSTGGPAEAWAKGLRNPWRFSFDRLTGDLFIGDVGQDAREEIDYQALTSRGGQNYGWKLMEGTLCGGGGNAGCTPPAPPCGDPAYTLPVLEYGHDTGNCSVTGGYVYRGLGVPDLYGMYVYGDYCSGTMWVAARQGGVWSTTPLSVTAPLLTTFGEDTSGDLYAGTEDGRLYRFAPAVPPVPSIASISPTSGLTRGGLVTITGANFTFGTQVFFGSVPAVVHVASPSILTAVAPAANPGTVDVTVSNTGAPPAIEPGAYTYLPIARVTPHGTPRTVIRGTRVLGAADRLRPPSPNQER
jgi:glucose/arabinose dehydrogenase